MLILADDANGIFTDLKNDMRTSVFLCPADDYQEGQSDGSDSL